MTQLEEKKSIGLGQIKSLTEKLEGKCTFLNNNELELNLKFKK